MRSLLHFPIILFLLAIGVSCSNNNDLPIIATKVITFKSDLKPVAGVTSNASGNATLQFNEATKTFKIEINFKGLKPGLAYIHGADRTIAFNFFPERFISPTSDPLCECDWSPISSPIYYNDVISDDQIEELMANHFYIDLRTQANPNGEIRGTLIKNNDD